MIIDPQVESMKLDSKDGGRAVVVTFTTNKGDFKLLFRMTQARQLMRALFLKVGVDPRLGDHEE